jgi:hypothetical protein
MSFSNVGCILRTGASSARFCGNNGRKFARLDAIVATALSSALDERAKAYVMGWATTGPLLEEQRWSELSRLDSAAVGRAAADS